MLKKMPLSFKGKGIFFCVAACISQQCAGKPSVSTTGMWQPAKGFRAFTASEACRYLIGVG